MTSDIAASRFDGRWLAITGETINRRFLPDVIAGAGVFLLVLALVVVGWEPLLTFDREAVRFLQGVVAGSDLLLTTTRAVTFMGGGEVSFVLLTSTGLWFAIRRARRAAAFVVASGIGVLIFDEGIKALVGRLRPVPDVPIAVAVGPSFPSGHALNATITYTVLLLVVLPVLSPRSRLVASLVTVAIVVLVGLTRPALGVHYPSDVVAAWGLGIVWVGITNRAFIWPQSPHAGAALRPTLTSSKLLPRGWTSAAQLLSGAVLLWGALLAAGTLVSDPQQVFVELDRVVLDWMVSIREPTLTELMGYLGRPGGTAGVLTALVLASTAAVAAFWRWRPALFILTSVAGETALFLATAAIVQRARPDSTLIENMPPTTSFPSGHAAAAAAMYGSVAILIWRHRRDGWGVAALTVAGCVVAGVAFSRLYEGAHFMTDILASVIYVAIWLIVTWMATRPLAGVESHEATRVESE